MLVQIAGKWLVLADYALNKEFIERTLCVNKAKPVLQCKGKCHLRKQLQKEDKGGEQQSQRSGQQKFQEVIWDVTTYVTPAAATPTLNTNKLANTVLYSSPYSSSIFHPPGIVI